MSEQNQTGPRLVSSTQQPQKPSLWHTVVHHPHVHLGANSTSGFMGVVLGLWIFFIFWVSSSAPSWQTVTWIITLYLVVEPVTAALTIVRKERWFPALIDILIGVGLVVETIIVLYDHEHLAVTGQRASVAAALLLATIGALVGSIIITLIVNTRIIGAVPVTGS